MTTWKDDRNALRKIAREHSTTEPTFVYVLISEMRGKLHMSTYKKYHGGWYDLAGNNHIAIETMADQAEWIRRFLRYPHIQKEFGEIAERILKNEYEQVQQAAS